MKLAIDWQTVLGSLLLGLTLVLSLPGIKVARADGADASAAQCSVAPEPKPVKINLAAEMRRKIAEAAAAQQGEGKPKIVMLNNRGYNYGSDPRLDVSELERAATTGR